jgi:hypothetical protein
MLFWVVSFVTNFMYIVKELGTLSKHTNLVSRF